MATKTIANKKKKSSKKKFVPNIVAFACNWCSYAGADNAGVNRIQYSPNFRVIRTMCSGRVTPGFVLKALKMGADGVLVSGCHFGDCHYLDANHETDKRIRRLQKSLERKGIRPTARAKTQRRGCHFGDCHYISGNYKAVDQFEKTKALVKTLGLEDERIRLEWVSAAEGPRWAEVINEFVGQITALGPSPLNNKPKYEN